jgi:hypothetical protein
MQTDTQRAKFLESISQGNSVCEAVKAAGLSRATVYRWRDEDPDFSQAWYDAREDYVDSLETMAKKRAAVSTAMLIFLLKSYRPQVFGDGKIRDTRPASTEELATRARLEAEENETRARRELEEIEARARRDMEKQRAELKGKAAAGDLLAQVMLSDRAGH